VRAESQLFGETDFDILVSNDGESGEILVTLMLYDGSDSELDSESRKTTIEGGDTTQVTISMDVPDEAEYYEATAEPL
jgi:hypothetical protein